MCIKDIIGDIRWDVSLILDANPDNKCGAESIFQEIEPNHIDGREGAKIRCDLKGLKTRSKSKFKIEVVGLSDIFFLAPFQ